MLTKRFLLMFFLALPAMGYSQLSLTKNIKLPADSLSLIRSLDGLLGFRGPNKDNTFVRPDLLIETSALLDELKTMKGNAGRLINVAPIDSSHFLVQLAYYLSGDLKGSFKLYAQRHDDGYLFASPLRRNMLTWKMQQTGNFKVYRNTAGPVPLLDRYIKAAATFDRKLKAPDYTTEIFYGDSFSDLMAFLGEDYRYDFNGYNNLNDSWFETGHNLQLIGAEPGNLTAFDLHDLWHNRLHHVVDVAVINRPIDEACAYLYGGSWGIYTWTDILRNFKTYMGSDRDWLKAFDEHRKFGGVKTPLYTDYVIDALIVQKIEKEQGFAQVIAFLSCGKKEPDNANYFKVLEKLTGITRANFNERVEGLLK